MKSFQIIALLLFSSFITSAQDYTPMAVEGATWFMVDQHENPEVFERIVLRIEGDTIVNNIEYSKMYYYQHFENGIVIDSRKLLGLLRDNIIDKKVYGGFLNETQYEFQTFLNQDARCDWGDSNTFNEHLLYDFSVVENDTLNSCMLSNPSIVSEIDTIERFGFDRRNLWLNDDQSTIMTEGIGTCIGIFMGQGCLLTGSGISYSLVNYCIGPFSNCDLLTSTKNNQQKDLLKLSPNPVSNLLSISNSNSFTKIQILDTHGRIINSFYNVNRINMSEYHKGTYIIKAQNKFGQVHSQLIIKI